MTIINNITIRRGRLVIGLIAILHSVAQADISGKVLRDINANALQDNAVETGLAGITIKAFANTDTTTPTSSTLSGDDGSYTLTGLASNTAYRIEFSWDNEWLKPGVAGGSLVQFAQDGDTDVNLVVSNPADYCQSSPLISTTRFWPLEQTSTNSTLVALPYSAGVTSPSGEAYKLDSWQDVALHDLGESRQLGAIFGIAWQRSQNYLYASAMKEQYVGFGPGGRGQIYRVQVDPNNGTVLAAPTPWVNLETDLNMQVCGTHNNLATAGYSDAEFDQVGKCSLGDLEISDDEQSIFATNLNTKQIVELATADASHLNTFDFPLHASDCPNNSTDAIYPFGLAYKDGKLFAGGVCSAEESNDATDLRVFVYRLDDPASKTWTKVLGFNPEDVRTPLYGPGTSWKPWRSAWSDAGGYYQGYESPMLSDIEFYGDNMILGLRDRTGDQLADNVIINGTTLNGVGSRGDIVCATANNDGQSYSLETASPNKCGPYTASGTGQGDGNGEFYWGDGNTQNASHAEYTMGNLAVFGGSNLLVGSINPAYAFGESTANAGGITWLDNNTGAANKAYYLYMGDGNNNSKGNGLGDLEALCLPAPIEVGNRVWLDSDADGIQDADETGIANVNVNLICGTDSATTSTDANGNFVFSNKTGANATFMDANEACQLTIDTTQANLQSYVVTTQDADNISTNHLRRDLRDSDASKNVDQAEINFTVGVAGENNHTLDFGFSDTPSQEVDLSLQKTANASQGNSGDEIIFTLTLSNAGPSTATNITVQDDLPVGMTYLSSGGGSSSQYDSVSLVTWVVNELPANESVELNVTVRLD